MPTRCPIYFRQQCARLPFFVDVVSSELQSNRKPQLITLYNIHLFHNQHTEKTNACLYCVCEVMQHTSHSRWPQTHSTRTSIPRLILIKIISKLKFECISNTCDWEKIATMSGDDHGQHTNRVRGQGGYACKLRTRRLPYVLCGGVRLSVSSGLSTATDRETMQMHTRRLKKCTRLMRNARMSSYAHRLFASARIVRAAIFTLSQQLGCRQHMSRHLVYSNKCIRATSGGEFVNLKQKM